LHVCIFCSICCVISRFLKSMYQSYRVFVIIQVHECLNLGICVFVLNVQVRNVKNLERTCDAGQSVSSSLIFSKFILNRSCVLCPVMYKIEFLREIARSVECTRGIPGSRSILNFHHFPSPGIFVWLIRMIENAAAVSRRFFSRITQAVNDDRLVIGIRDVSTRSPLIFDWINYESSQVFRRYISQFGEWYLWTFLKTKLLHMMCPEIGILNRRKRENQVLRLLKYFYIGFVGDCKIRR